MAEPTAHGTASAARIANIAHRDGRAMAVEAIALAAGRVARVSTPLLIEPGGGTYAIMGCSRLASGQTVKLEGETVAAAAGVIATIFIQLHDPQTRRPGRVHRGPPARLEAGRPFQAMLEVPELDGWPAVALGIEVCGEGDARIIVDRIAVSGAPRFRLAQWWHRNEANAVVGWVTDLDVFWRGAVRGEEVQPFGKNEGRGIAVTGTTDWRDYRFSARFCTYLMERAGLIVRYQGLERYLALIKTRDALQLVIRHYGDRILAEAPLTWQEGELHVLAVDVRGVDIVASVDGHEVLRGRDDALGCGGFGFLVERGSAGFRDVEAVAYPS